jgi:urease accessory protein
MKAALFNPAQTWFAELDLRFAWQHGRTVLAERRHQGPLVVQRPFYPEGKNHDDPCHVYLVHPPGGIAGGDHLQLNVTVQNRAHALITTPAATKFYRALPDRQSVLKQCLQVHEATLEWLPQENIYFNAASVRTVTRMEIDGLSRCIAWEVNCYGRRAGDQPFVEGRIHQGLELWVDGKPLLLDHLHIDGGVMQHTAWGLQDMPVLGSLIAFPATRSDVDAVRQLGMDESHFGCTLVDGALLCRCVCADGAEARRMLLRVWECLRPRIVQRQAVQPRIWAT